MDQSWQPTDTQVVNAVLQSKQSIVQVYQDILKGAQAGLTQAETSGNKDSMINAQELFAKAQTQLQQAQASLAQATEFSQGS